VGLGVDASRSKWRWIQSRPDPAWGWGWSRPGPTWRWSRSLPAQRGMAGMQPSLNGIGCGPVQTQCRGGRGHGQTQRETGHGRVQPNVG